MGVPKLRQPTPFNTSLFMNINSSTTSFLAARAGDVLDGFYSSLATDKHSDACEKILERVCEYLAKPESTDVVDMAPRRVLAAVKLLDATTPDSDKSQAWHYASAELRSWCMREDPTIDYACAFTTPLTSLLCGNDKDAQVACCAPKSAPLALPAVFEPHAVFKHVRDALNSNGFSNKFLHFVLHHDPNNYHNCANIGIKFSQRANDSWPEIVKGEFGSSACFSEEPDLDKDDNELPHVRVVHFDEHLKPENPNDEHQMFPHMLSALLCDMMLTHASTSNVLATPACVKARIYNHQQSDVTIHPCMRAQAHALVHKELQKREAMCNALANFRGVDNASTSSNKKMKLLVRGVTCGGKTTATPAILQQYGIADVDSTDGWKRDFIADAPSFESGPHVLHKAPAPCNTNVHMFVFALKACTDRLHGAAPVSEGWYHDAKQLTDLEPAIHANFDAHPQAVALRLVGRPGCSLKAALESAQKSREMLAAGLLHDNMTYTDEHNVVHQGVVTGKTAVVPGITFKFGIEHCEEIEAARTTVITSQLAKEFKLNDSVVGKRVCDILTN